MANSDKQSSWFGRHKILTGLLILIVLGVIVSAAGGSKTKTSTSSTSSTTSSSKPAPTVAKLNQPVRDGKFEFTVSGVECGKTSVGPNQYLQKTAQGQYCLMTVSVKNIGDAQQLFAEDNQKILNAAGQQYSPDGTATLYNSNNSDAFLSQINPGNTVQGVLVYDIPKDQTPATAELHDSVYSGGIKVSLQ